MICWAAYFFLFFSLTIIIIYQSILEIPERVAGGKRKRKEKCVGNAFSAGGLIFHVYEFWLFMWDCFQLFYFESIWVNFLGISLTSAACLISHCSSSSLTFFFLWFFYTWINFCQQRHKDKFLNIEWEDNSYVTVRWPWRRKRLCYPKKCTAKWSLSITKKSPLLQKKKKVFFLERALWCEIFWF